MRGNLGLGIGSKDDQGPIPAYAGEPTCMSQTSTIFKAYPRVCGGTLSGSLRSVRVMGLSPRMRGNQCSGGIRGSCRGPIPAYAGEPAARRSSSGVRGAYPRVCGGTASGQVEQMKAQGLSPRMRGNPLLPQQTRRYRGPIPAYAGEPRSWHSHRPASWAYPRVCGGTPASWPRH